MSECRDEPIAAGRPAVLPALGAIVLAGAGVRGWQAAHARLAHESVDERVYAALARTLAEDLQYGDRSSGPQHPFIAAPVHRSPSPWRPA